MNIFGKIANFVSGGLGEKIVETVAGQFPAKLDPAEKAKIEAAIMSAARQHEIALLTLAQEEQRVFDARLSDLEGTAKDLQQFGVLGKLVVFLRGLQRPLWGFIVVYLDLMVFSGGWQLSDQGANGLDLMSAFWVINVLVLGFLFGERAVRNVMPVIARMQNRQEA